MKKTLYILCCLACLISRPSLAAKGPFGLSIGMALDQIDKNAQQIDHGVYATKNVPKTDRSFVRYSLVITPAAGLCKISAVGESIPTKPSGNKLIKQFNKMSRKLKKKYGEGETTDFIEPQSKWKEPEHFMRSLREKDRTLETVWKNTDSDPFKDEIETVSLQAMSSKPEKGYLMLEYEFTNFDACMAEISRK